jgi:hypothetical protein
MAVARGPVTETVAMYNGPEWLDNILFSLLCSFLPEDGVTSCLRNAVEIIGASDTNRMPCKW